MNFRRAFLRPRTKTVVILSSLLLLLCFVTVMFPSSTVLQTSYETASIVVQSRRSEYYILNRDFFVFLARTSMECHIEVEPGAEWSGEATVRTKLLDSDTTPDDEDTRKEYGWTGAINTNGNTNKKAVEPGEGAPKYVLAYRHFEQLGKTTENLIQLAAMAKRLGRQVVQPDVKNSRFSLSPGSRSYPLDVYFNVSNMNELLDENNYSKLVGLSSFLRDCNYVNTETKTTVVHFLYNDFYRGNTMKWYHLKQSQFQEILNKTLHTGWTDCPFIEKHLGFSTSFNGINIGRQLCVNPEVVLSETVFEEKILGGDKCVVLVEWRGFGRFRAHFSPNYRPFLGPKELTHNIEPSYLIKNEVNDFKRSKLSSGYISVHLRTERLLLRNSFKKLQLCIEHVVYLVDILRELRGLSTVFLATDMTRFGSDKFDSHKFYTSNATGLHLVRRKDFENIHADVVRRLKAVSYKPLREPYSKDKGIVSLVEMNILKGGVDLVTVGSGTFRAWLVSVFRQHQKHSGRRGYTISEICNDGSK